jgi:glycerol-3-phosphate dehydrogenase (NAD(P)+)
MDINEFHKNLKYLDCKLEENITATNNLNDVLKDSEIVIFAVPSVAFRTVCEKSKGLVSKNAIIIILTKGIEEESSKTMSEIANEYFNNEIVVVAGPSIANEIAKKILSFVVFASKSNKAIEKCKSIFSKEYYNILASNDVFGAETCSFLKNAYAIYLGIIDGLGYGLNTKAGIFVKVLNEMKLFSEKIGVNNETVYSLAGLGDLLVTGFSAYGRNKKFGELIAKGESIQSAKKIIGQTVEGIIALKVAKELSNKKEIDAPILEKIYSIIFLNTKPSI